MIGFAVKMGTARRLHRNDIRVPLVVLIRLYPRALEHGQPDLIESAMQFVASYGDDALPELFPATVFTGR